VKNYPIFIRQVLSDKDFLQQMLFITAFTFVLFIFLFYSELVLAQDQTLIKGAEDNGPGNAINLNETGDIEFTANVHINELVFRKVGNTTIHFPGNQQRKLIDRTIRTNLPAEIKPNVIYRNVEINVQILTSFVKVNGLINDLSALNTAEK
jgi:hypothetical protein